MKLVKIKEEKKAGKVTFLIKDSDEVFANTIRRTIVEEVPTLAAEDLEIKENSSALYDEMLGLRLGLIPIKTDLKSYSLPQSQEEVEMKNARCTLQIKLKSSSKGIVYADAADSADPKCTFVYPKMPILKLLPKQKVDVTITAVMGQGKDHVKWSPGWAFFRTEPKLEVGKVKDPQRIMDNCTDGVFSLKGSTLTVNKDKVAESRLLDHYASLDPEIKVSSTGNYIFKLESWGQLSTKDILSQAATIISQKAEELEKTL